MKTVTRTPAQLHGSSEGSPLHLYTMIAQTQDGRRFLYFKELTEDQFNKLVRLVYGAGGIDVTNDCWQEMEPVYGSVAYQVAGMEYYQIEREYNERDW